MTDKPPSQWAVGRVLDIVREMRERQIAQPAIDNDEGDLRTIYPDWAETSTAVDPNDVLRRLVRAAIEADSMDEAIERRIDDLRVRQERYVGRRKEYRASIAMVMQALELDRFTDTDATVTLRPNRGGALITSGDPPDEYARITRAWDKTRAKQALLDGEVVENAALSQGGEPILTIRSK